MVKIKTKYSMGFNSINKTFISNNKKLFLIQSTKWKKEGKKEWEECKPMQEEPKLKFIIKIKFITQTTKLFQKKVWVKRSDRVIMQNQKNSRSLFFIYFLFEAIYWFLKKLRLKKKYTEIKNDLLS